MRDAFGGVFMIKLMLVFLVIFVCFIVIGINFSKAFRAKNGIIDYIEQYKGHNSLSEPHINSYLDRLNYYVPMEDSNGNYANSNGSICYDRGYCIETVNSTKYTVITFMQIDFLGLSFTVPIKGEASIYSS